MIHYEKQIHQYLVYCEMQKKLSYNSIRAYKIDMGQFINFVKSYSATILFVKEIDKALLQDYIKQLQNDYMPKTCKRKIACLKAFFNYLEFEDIIDINPMRKIRMQIKEPQPLPKTLKCKDIQSLLQFLYGKLQEKPLPLGTRFNLLKEIAALELLFATGMRVGELCHLPIDAIDFDQGLVRVIGKGRKERIIYIVSPDVLHIISEYIATRELLSLASPYLFINANHNRFTEDSVRQLLKRLAKHLLNNKRVTPHMFRHTFASLLLEAGMDIKYIQELLGHSSISTTLIYLHISNAAIKADLIQKHPRLRADFILPDARIA